MKLKSLLVSLGLLAGAAAVQAEEPLKVGFIYVGPVGDLGWSYEHTTWAVKA